MHMVRAVGLATNKLRYRAPRGLDDVARGFDGWFALAGLPTLLKEAVHDPYIGPRRSPAGDGSCA